MNSAENRVERYSELLIGQTDRVGSGVLKEHCFKRVVIRNPAVLACRVGFDTFVEYDVRSVCF